MSQSSYDSVQDFVVLDGVGDSRQDFIVLDTSTFKYTEMTRLIKTFKKRNDSVQDFILLESIGHFNMYFDVGDSIKTS